MKDFNKYFIVGTNSDALHDTMNGTVIGELIRCMDCKYWSAEIEQTAIPNMHKCTWWRTIGTLPIDFCSRAERKPPQVNPEMVKALVDRIEKQRGEDAKRKR